MKVYATNEQMKQTGVYCIRCNSTSRVYIGSAAQSFKERLRRHLNNLRQGSHHSSLLQRAWDKYGIDAFEFTILRVTVPAEAVEFEQAFIDLYKAADRKYGYNLAPLAGSNLGVKHSQEVCRANSQRMKAHFADPEAHKTQSELTKAYFEKNPEARQRISKQLKDINTARPELAKANSDQAKKRYRDRPELGVAHSQKMKTYWSVPERRTAHSDLKKAHYSQNPDACKRASQAALELHARRPEIGIEHSERMKTRFANPEARRRGS